MSSVNDTFFTTVGCMDGRVQEPIAKFGKERFNAKFADTITEAGLVGLLSKENVDSNLLRSVKNKIEISLQKHHSKGIIVHGHGECAGNPIEDKTHKKDVIKTAQVIRSLIPENVKVIPVFVKIMGENWIIEELNL